MSLHPPNVEWLAPPLPGEKNGQKNWKISTIPAHSPGRELSISIARLTCTLVSRLLLVDQIWDSMMWSMKFKIRKWWWTHFHSLFIWRSTQNRTLFPMRSARVWDDVAIMRYSRNTARICHTRYFESKWPKTKSNRFEFVTKIFSVQFCVEPYINFWETRNGPIWLLMRPPSFL
jgi:hypothetical protein